MSTREILSAAKEPYRKLWAYLKPYKGRFMLAILFGALYGALNGGLAMLIRHVSAQVFPNHPPAAEAPAVPGSTGQVATAPPALETAAATPPPAVASPSANSTVAVPSSTPEAAAAAPPAAENTESKPKDERGFLRRWWESFTKRKPAQDNGVAVNLIIGTCLLIPLTMIIRAVFGYLNAYCMTWVSLRMLDDIRGDLFKRVLGQSMEFFNKQKSADLMQLIFNQTRVAQQALTQIAGDVIKEPLAIISAVIAMGVTDWKFTLGALVLFPLCILPVLIVSKKVRKAGAQEEEEAGAMNVIMQEAFLGIRLVKSSGREEYEIDRFNRSNNKMLENMMRWQKALQIVGQLVEVVASFGVAAALVYVWMKYQGRGGASDFIMLNASLMMLYPPAKTLSRIPIQMQKCLAATTKIFEFMERPVRVQDRPDAKEIQRSAGHIQYQDVGFHYEKNKPAVQHVTLDIESGERVALVGPSGSGKSTLFSLLLRFYDVRRGSILLDGTDLRDITQKSLREQIGIVSQDVFLFHDTIHENIRYGRLDATEEEIIEAAKRAHAHDFILAQPNGYETVIGDKGCNLSGGQQQRLAIARAFLRNAPILMLDEATSALDTESERLIQADLEELARGRTVLAIAHRLSTIRNSDKIVVMDKGTVVAVGPHEHLLATCELYQTLYNLQYEPHGTPVSPG